MLPSIKVGSKTNIPCCKISSCSTALLASTLVFVRCKTGGKQDFQVANLLLVTVNFKPWLTTCISQTAVKLISHL